MGGFGQMVSGGMAIGAATQQDSYARQAIDRNIQQVQLDKHFQNLNSTNSLVQGQALAAHYRMQGTAQAQQADMGFAASGVDAAVGTPNQARSTSALFSELDAQTAINNSRRQAWGFTQASWADDTKIQTLNEQYGQADMTAGFGVGAGAGQIVSGVASLIGGAGGG